MHCDTSKQHLLFPTPIWEYQFEEAEAFNSKLAGDIEAFDWHQYKTEHQLSFGDDLTSRNEDTFIPLDRAPGIMQVLQMAIEKATENAPTLGWSLDGQAMQVTEYWANVNEPNDYNMQHNHVPSHISGVYYVRVPEGSGRIKFFDERRIRTLAEPDSSPVEITASEHVFDPKPGMMLLFPSWLDHLVGQNRSNEVRISISFNMDLVALPTA